MRTLKRHNPKTCLVCPAVSPAACTLDRDDDRKYEVHITLTGDSILDARQGARTSEL